MPITFAPRTYSIGSVIAIIVLILCVVLAVVGGPVTPFVLLMLVAALALALLI
jgi:hypothetical protein